MEMKTILVVDDKQNIRTLVREVLEAEGFAVALAENGVQALQAARREKPALILLDVMMPEMNGYEFIRIYRKEFDTPIILLTAKLEEIDKVIGLELGADDYITKPFGMKELVARVNAVLRRAGGLQMQSSAVLTLAGLRIDSEAHSVTAGGVPLPLTPSEFDLLLLMANNPLRVYSRADLLVKLHGSDFENVERTVDVHIRNLRAKLQAAGISPSLIETVFGVGYKLNPQ